jgi:hypothetical protein
MPSDERPRAIVVDLMSFAGFDVADSLDIPWMVNNADLLQVRARSRTQLHVCVARTRSHSPPHTLYPHCTHNNN